MAGSVVFVDPQDAAAMDRTTLLVHRALSSPAYARVVRENAPAVARLTSVIVAECWGSTSTSAATSRN